MEERSEGQRRERGERRGKRGRRESGEKSEERGEEKREEGRGDRREGRGERGSLSILMFTTLQSRLHALGHVPN